MHGMRSITSHSTAFFSSTLSTVRMLLTVFGASCSSGAFSRCTSSLLIASSLLSTERRHQVQRGGSRSSPQSRSASADSPVAWPSRNLGAKLCRVGTSFVDVVLRRD